MDLADAITEITAVQEAAGSMPRTVSTNCRRLQGLAQMLAQRGVRSVAEVTAADLDAVFMLYAERGVRQTSRRSYASTVREFFRCCQDRGWLLRNPAADLPIPDDDDIPLPEAPLDEVEVADLFANLPRRDAVDLRNRAHLELLYGCALRLAESVHLDLGDLDFQRRTLQVRAGKGGHDRTIPLMPGTIGAVQDYLAVRRTMLRGPDHGALLLDRHGRRIREDLLPGILRRLGRKRGRRLHPHLFRHSIAVHLLRGGADIRHVQQFLGHSSLETTKIYLRMVPGHLREAYDAAMPAIAVGA
jgi:site-specific recombinase XerD